MRALIIVDVQNDFTEGGALPVTGGAEVARRIARYVAKRYNDYDVILATADWHEDPGDHWASNEDPTYIDTWPIHCQAGTAGARFHEAVVPALEFVHEIFRKGRFEAAYSGFEGTSDDGDDLGLWLHERAVTDVDVCGLATDHCVKATAIDSCDEGFTTRVLLGLCAGVAPETTEAALAQMRELGIELVEA